MTLDPRVCYRALRTRDARFDGRFFTAVRSTGVYCRPVCPAPTPRQENCLFLPCAAAAQEAGFRPCLRCRPETSPGTPAWLGTSATVSRALRLIAEGALDMSSLDALAARLGVGQRHLRRLFVQHLGASPLAVAQTRRILFAKKLIDETTLPMTEVGFAAGFSSIRRFNDAIRSTYSRTPSDLRRAARKRAAGPDHAGTANGLTLKLPFRPPFDWELMAAYLAGRATPGVETVGADFYRRTVSVDGVHGIVEVRPVAREHHVVANIQLASPAGLIHVTERLRRIFDLGADPAEISTHLGTDGRLAAQVRARPGLRIPGAWDGFELAVRAILGQQVSVKAATTLAGRLAAAHGERLEIHERDAGRGELRYVFPGPAAIADADLTQIGVTRARALAITGLARAVARGDVVLDASRGLEATVEALSALPGIGDWTAQYVAMRALREPDAFPASDLGLRRALGGESGPMQAHRLLEVAEAWRPWRAYAAVHLWTMDGVRRTQAASRGRGDDAA